MIVGSGVDLVEIVRIEHLYRRYGETFVRRILCEAEQHELHDCSQPARLLARRFAAKEAAAKALGTGFSGGIGLRMICVVHDPRGRPQLEFSGAAKLRADEIGTVASWLSISDEKRYAIAQVILEGRSA